MREWFTRLWDLPSGVPVWLWWIFRLLLVAVGVLVWPVLVALWFSRREGSTWLNRGVPVLLVMLWIPWLSAVATAVAMSDVEGSSLSPASTEIAVNQFADTEVAADAANDMSNPTAALARETTTTLERTTTASSAVQATSTAPAPLTTSTVTTSTSTPAPTTDTTATAVVTGDKAQVVSITDGDTIRVSIGGVVEPLRLIGINAPEGGECMAAEATARLTALVGGETVHLESDKSDRDQYDRLLRYVYVGDLFIHEVLVREGLAVANRYEPDTAKATILEAAQTQAETNQVGMWAANACGVAAAGDIRVGLIRYDADGNDNENLNDEWVELVNQGTTGIDLTGWGVKDESASHRYNFPNGFTLGAGATVRLHTGCGTNTSAFLYWCNTGSAVWNNSGDTVFILDPNGNIVDSKSY